MSVPGAGRCSIAVIQNCRSVANVQCFMSRARGVYRRKAPANDNERLRTYANSPSVVYCTQEPSEAVDSAPASRPIPEGTPRTSLCQQSNRSLHPRNGNWKIATRDRSQKPAPQEPKCQKLRTPI
jgi:hypothetical protein